ncbi:MAG: alpha-amylase family glycosyl hydrolase [Acidobacteriota bacterium]|nr:alpha-amylase family glycosyl hydrolase [Acidobacteriota bacterium]
MQTPAVTPAPAWELLISRRAREQYGIERAPRTGSELQGLRALVQRINRRRAASAVPATPLASGQVNALRLVEEVLHHLLVIYLRRAGDEVLDRALAWLQGRFGEERVERLLETFVDFFPQDRIYRGSQSAEEYLRSAPEARREALQRLLVLWTVQQNPAAEALADLFDDEELEDTTGYRQMVASLRGFFARQPSFSAGSGNFFDLLQSPARARPDSLTAQLEFLLKVFGPELESLDLEDLVAELQLGVDVLREEEKPIFQGPGGGPPGPGPIEVPQYVDLSEEEERFTEDRDWMPEVVLVAKNTLVWLDQLSRAYGRRIQRLDQIPDEELARLARWGFTGLWLIGLWERSRASETIKKMCGNPEAAASAYSLQDYRVAEELGGDAAVEVLRRRAARHRLRLACDMVPNHMGIDSHWLLERPDLFLTLPESPYPNYTFRGPDLSPDPRIAIHLEDHYYDRSDAAVVFRRLDRRTGEARYVYHGNDGTSMPWNDTAQLDYLNAETRETVIQIILSVARRFPIIRFDAAMTLARRHIQRLWFPQPGSGGAIPSRSEHGMSQEEFLRHMPEEFWREVVDRVAQEAPDTLLLAEAFWLMEGYFVRTLGMHRVYNSAFMHMLRDEDNGKFRSTLKNTLEFDPEVLKRFVNYVTNPDEKSAVEQLGKGDKYFGVATVMATLPGLPMFGHGQFEGLHEKYGMEYRRAYADEDPDAWVIDRHEREIVPLLKKRYLFAEVRYFRLYDFVLADGSGTSGSVCEDVLAYSNRYGPEAAVVLYNNRYQTVSGWVRTSVPWQSKAGDAGGLQRQNLGDALDLEPAPDRFCRYREQISGLEFLVPTEQLCGRGLFARLHAYERRILLDFQVLVDDEEGRYRTLAESLQGRGVPDLGAALDELLVRPVQGPVRGVLHGDLLQRLWAARELSPEERKPLLDEVETRSRRMLGEIQPLVGTGGGAAPEAEADTELLARLAAEQRRGFEAVLEIQALAAHGEGTEESVAGQIARELLAGEWSAGSSPSDGELPEPSSQEPPPRETATEDQIPPDRLEETPTDDGRWLGLLSWALLRPLGRLLGEQDAAARGRALAEVWMLDRVVEQALLEAGIGGDAAGQQAAAAKLFVGLQGWYRQLEEPGVGASGDPTTGRLMARWLLDDEVARFLNVHAHDGVRWFHREAFQLLRWWLLASALAEWRLQGEPEAPPPPTPDGDAPKASGETWLARAHAVVGELRSAEDPSGYRVQELLVALGTSDELDVLQPSGGLMPRDGTAETSRPEAPTTDGGPSKLAVPDEGPDGDRINDKIPSS